MSNQHQELNKLLKKENPSTKERQEIVMLIRNGGFDIPDALFQNAYLAYKSNPKSNQSTYLQQSGYINLQSIVYSGLELKINSGVIKKFLIAFKNKIGLNQYIERLNEFIKWVGIKENNPNYMDEILREDQGDCQAHKKKLASYKRFSSYEEYVQKINDFLELEPSDQQAWIELGQLYTQKGNYMKAIFCFEELVVLNPSNDDYIQKLAELYLTFGGKANEEKAIKYLSLLVNKRPDNMRALWMLYRVTKSLQSYNELNQVNVMQLEMCEGCINKMYSKRAPSVKIHIAM